MLDLILITALVTFFGAAWGYVRASAAVVDRHHHGGRPDEEVGS